jgi:subtilisin family serine protease
MSKCRRFLLLTLRALPFFCWTVAAMAAAPGTDSGKVGAEVHAQLAKAPYANVMVALIPPSQAMDAAHRQSRAHEIAANVDAVLASLPTDGYRLRRRFEQVAALSMDIDVTTLELLRNDAHVLRIDLDVGGRAQMNQAAPLARVSNVRNRGFTGQQVKTAVIDSGVQLNHIDLADSIVDQQCFCSSATPGTGCCPNGLDTQGGAGSGADAEGHGTNVTGIITGNGGNAPQGGAPAAKVVIVRVLDAHGSFYSSSDIVAALDWIAVHHPDTRAINMSVGTNALFSSVCDSSASYTIALSQAVAAVNANGGVMTASSGNQASTTSVSAPACLANVIAVGAVWDAAMSNQTFLGCADTGIVADKPTCFTNSNSKVALYAPGAYTTATGLDIDPFTVGFSSTYGGTSQASPLVAACVADLYQLRPNLTPAQVKAALIASDVHVVDPKNGLSFPRLNCDKALTDLDRIFANGFD